MVERDAEGGRHRLRSVALPPVRSTDPVAQLGAISDRVEAMEADSSEKLPIDVTRHLEGEPFALPSVAVGPADMRQGVATGVPPGDVQRSADDGRVGEQFAQALRLADRGQEPLDPLSPDRKVKTADPLGRRGGMGRHGQPRRPRPGERALGRKLRYIREGVGCDETFRYFADRLAE